MTDVVQLNGNLLANGYFSGDGNALINLNASNIASGTLPDSALSPDLNAPGNVQVSAGYLTVGSNDGFGYALVMDSAVNEGTGNGNGTVIWQAAGNTRWTLTGGSREETGSDGVGSDFSITRANNAGAYTGTPLRIARSHGGAKFSGGTLTYPSAPAGWYRIAAIPSTGSAILSCYADTTGGQTNFTIVVPGNSSLEVAILGVGYLYEQNIDQIRICVDASRNTFVDLHDSGAGGGGIQYLNVYQFSGADLSLIYNPSLDGLTTQTYAVPMSGNFFSGGVTAGLFIGSGASLTSLNASNLSSGTVDANRGGAGAVTGILKANGAGVVSAASPGLDYQLPVLMTENTSGSISFNNLGKSETIYNPSSGTLSSATVSLPSTSIPGQILRYITNGAITTVSTSGTVSIGTPVTSLSASASVAWQAQNTTGTWIRLQ